ncbi:MAG: hypothetical protein JXR49_04655 [Acidobacteria bacterium]|nr:hypothetical protein [Acidobacteriota bacterium]
MRYLGFTILILLFVLSLNASAVTPQFWENFTQADLLEGSLDRMSLSPDGKLFLSPAYDRIFDTGQPYIFSMVRDSRGNLYVGTGDDGKVFRIDPQGKGTLFFQAEEINVFALAIDANDSLYAGTSPDGKIYKITGPDQATLFFDSEEKYIWSMIFDDAGNLYVGTGGGGVIYRLDENGAKTVFFSCSDTHVMCLARDKNGNLIAGTAPGGLVIEISSEGKGFTLLDTPMEEVHSITFDRFGDIFAVASSAAGIGLKAASPEPAPKNKTAPSTTAVQTGLKADSTDSRTATATVTAPGGNAASAGNRSVVYAISKDRGMETIYASKTQMVYDSVTRGDGSLLLATGPKGRLLSIDTTKQVSVVSDTEEEQLTRLLADGDIVYVAGSNQGRLYKLQSERSGTGVFKSKILDARTVASWGKISWQVKNPGDARIEFSTRTGNTEKIDNSWSEWSPPYTSSGTQVVSPKARYLQWRVTVRQDSASVQKPAADLLDRIRIAYLQQNLRPQVTSIEVLPYGIEFQKQPALAISGTAAAIPARTSDGRSLNSPRERENSALKPVPRRVLKPGAQSFTWKASDDNRDSLEFSLYFKGESESDWKLLEERHPDTFYTLYASSLPDGIYRLKVVARDALSNPYDDFLIGELVSRPFVIANTPPQVEIKTSEVRGRSVEVAFDAYVLTGSIATAEFSIDGGDWNLVFPDDGIADSAQEAFRITTSDLSAGEHLIGIRASDRDGNTGISKVVVQIP